MKDEPLYTPTQVCHAAGTTYRQLDYWVRSGYIETDLPAPGSGHPRRLQFDQVVQTALLADLVQLGIAPRTFGHDSLSLLRSAGTVRLGSVTLTYDRRAHRRHVIARLENS